MRIGRQKDYSLRITIPGEWLFPENYFSLIITIPREWLFLDERNWWMLFPVRDSGWTMPVSIYAPRKVAINRKVSPSWEMVPSFKGRRLNFLPPPLDQLSEHFSPHAGNTSLLCQKSYYYLALCWYRQMKPSIRRRDVKLLIFTSVPPCTGFYCRLVFDYKGENISNSSLVREIKDPTNMTFSTSLFW